MKIFDDGFKNVNIFHLHRVDRDFERRVVRTTAFDT